MMSMLITMISMVVFATMIIRITMHWITITMIVTNNDNNDNNDTVAIMILLSQNKCNLPAVRVSSNRIRASSSAKRHGSQRLSQVKPVERIRGSPDLHAYSAVESPKKV